jgi:hypothetical protein
MHACLALVVILGDVSPPIVGRPVDFSGAVGGPFVVQWHADRTQIVAEEPIALTIRLTGPGNLAEMPRPDLAKLESFKPFAVENVDDRFIAGDPPRREFRYRVRPRTPTVTEIPRFKLVYFNPRIVPASRGYQTTYAEPLPLAVKPRAVEAPPEVPGWMLEPPATDDLYGPPPPIWQVWLDRLRERIGVESEEPAGGLGWLIATALIAPPAICFVIWAVWRRLYPDAAKLTAGRRSRAAAVALRALDRSDGHAERIAAAMIEYLRNRAGLSSPATTPAEIGDSITALDLCNPPIAATIAVLQRCDAARFAAEPPADSALATDAAKLVLDWEAVAWPASGS